MDSKYEIRMRVAFVPHDSVFVGIARAILYNMMFKEAVNGKLILRIDDTDQGTDFNTIKNIINQLHQLGLSWDEGPDIGGTFGPYIQSQRLSLYEKHTRYLLKNKSAYHCFCEPGKNANCGCSNKCYNLPDETILKYKKYKKSCVRFKLLHKIDYIEDLIHGKITVDTSLLIDPVIERIDGTPTFHLATVVDDHMMKVNHILRGVDHINGAFIQKQIFESLDYEVPTFAHFSIFLDSSRKNLSAKSYSNTISYFLEKGYLHVAIQNFLIGLGYWPKLLKDNEIHSFCEYVKSFNFSNFSFSNQIFNIDKLIFFNKMAIKNMDNDIYLKYSQNYLSNFSQYNYKIVLSLKDRISCFFELKENLNALYDGKDEELAQCLKESDSNSKKYDDYEILLSITYKVSKIKIWNKSNINDSLNCEHLVVERKYVYLLLRKTLTLGKTFGDLIELIENMGKSFFLNRINKALIFLKTERS